jgi:hypothetical protein
LKKEPKMGQNFALIFDDGAFFMSDTVAGMAQDDNMG